MAHRRRASAAAPVFRQVPNRIAVEQVAPAFGDDFLGGELSVAASSDTGLQPAKDDVAGPRFNLSLVAVGQGGRT